MDTKYIKACIFDFDGVIIDSERNHARAKEATLKHFKITYPADIFERFKGRPDNDFFAHVFQHLSKNQVSAEELLEFKKSIYTSLFEVVRLIQGVNEFIRFARTGFEKLGITTSTTLHDFTLAMQKFDIERHFDFIITGEDTQKHKPDPEPYLLAEQKLQLGKRHAIVIEDSPNGIISATGAGFKAVGITTSFTKEELLNSGAEYVVNSFRELEDLLLGR